MTPDPPRPDQALRIVGRPLFRVVGDEVFVLMPDSQVHWLRNATARALWEHLLAAGPAGTTAAALAELLSEQFETTKENALGDVLAFLAGLRRVNLVTHVEAGEVPD